MAKKYYAIKKGLVPGIYDNWPEAQAQVKGFPGAEYKGFATEEEAKAFMEGALGKTSTKEFIPPEPYAFTDGSFNAATGVYGYGGFLVVGGVEYVLQGSGDDPEEAKHRNVSGEVKGAMSAIAKAKELGLQQLTICYDYEGVRQWALPPEEGWKANVPLSQNYRAFAADCGIELSFIHTKGHSGIPGNERADRLAKEAVGLE